MSPRAEKEQLLLVLSDVEMGAGGETDDCPHAGSVGALVRRYAARRRHASIDVVFNGDTFDFLKTPIGESYPVHLDDTIALQKLQRISAAHRDFFEELAGAMETHGDLRVHFLAGNHDFELFFPRVQEAIRTSLAAASDRVTFPGLTFDLGEVHVEHGSQGDVLFRIDPDRPFTEHDGRTILNLPWGCVGLIDVALPYHRELYALDRVKPKDLLFQAVPEARDLLLIRALHYWSYEYWRGAFFEKDPLKRVRWETIKEVTKRLISVNAEVSFGEYYLRAAQKDPAHKLFIVGHQHQPAVKHGPDKTVLELGCLRDEFILSGDSLRPAERSIAEVQLRNGAVTAARLLPVNIPVTSTPPDLGRIRPIAARRLEELRGRLTPSWPFPALRKKGEEAR